MPLLEDPREQLRPSLDQTLAFHASLESWLLARPTSTLPQPRPFLRPRNPEHPNHTHTTSATTQTTLNHTPTPGAQPHSQIHKSVHHEQRRLHVRYRHDHTLHSTNIPSCNKDRTVYTIDEEEDVNRAIDIHSLHYLSDQAHCQPIRPVHSRAEITCGGANNFPRLPLSTSTLATFLDAQQSLGRSLTTIPFALTDEMTTVAPAPDSPPDLSGSKSSKSSSYHSSSQLSNPDGAVSDISNFEDIVLEDDVQSPTSDTFAVSRHTLPKRPTSHTNPSPTVRQNTVPMSQQRDLTTNTRNYPGLQSQIEGATTQNVVDEALGAPRRTGGPRRQFTSPSVPSLPPSKNRDRRPSRSPSPANAPQSAVSGRSYFSRTPSSPGKLQPNARRGSWQPPRKTTKQLEAEYRDSDDELEDDTALWNVPMSPRPNHERPASRRSSRAGSPDRLSPGPPPIPLAHSVSVPDDISNIDNELQPLPRHKLPPRTTSLNINNPPPGPSYRASFRDNRVKSWTLAMSDLSEEARVLNEALEYHADDAGRIHEEKVQRGTRSARPSLEASKRTSKGMVELPPLQKGNVMIDPLPISKEKEKVLARTRPSWLPPKDPKEEKRHLKEYQRMMAASLEAEKKRESKERLAKQEKDESRAELDRIWEDYVYPNPDQASSEHREKELWWKGVSPSMRGLVWQRAVGNELALTAASYKKALSRSHDICSSKSQDDETKRVKQLLASIRHDTITVYPELNLFQPTLPMHDALVNVLSAYAMYRSDVGYLYGLNLVAAAILLQVSNPADAFILLANILNRSLSLAFLTGDPAATSRKYDLALSTLSYKNPRLHHHLFSSASAGGLGLQPEDVFEPMFRTLLSNGLDFENLCRVWDSWVFEGDRTIIRAAVAILGLLEGQLTLMEGEDVQEKREKIRSLLGWGPWGRKAGLWDFRGLDGGNEDGFMNKVFDAGKLEE